MHVKVSAGGTNLRFLQVTRGKVSAPSGNLREIYFVRVMAELLTPMHVYVDLVLNDLSEVIAGCF